MKGFDCDEEKHTHTHNIMQSQEPAIGGRVNNNRTKLNGRQLGARLDPSPTADSGRVECHPLDFDSALVNSELLGHVNDEFLFERLSLHRARLASNIIKRAQHSYVQCHSSIICRGTWL